jgi:O-antigen ligase
VICTVALLLTFTRAAIIAVAAGLLLLLWLIRSPLLRPLRVAWFVVAVIAISVLAVPALQNNSTFEKGIVRAGTLTQRESYWGFALPIATSNAHNMLFGIGSGALEAPNVAANVPVAAEVSASPQVVKNSLHSQYLTTLLEQGLLGLTVMVLFLVSVFLPCARLARKTRDPALSALAASILSMAIIMSVDTTFLHGPSFAMLMVSAGLITGALTHRADAVRSSPEETSHGNVGTAQTG